MVYVGFVVELGMRRDSRQLKAQVSHFLQHANTKFLKKVSS